MVARGVGASFISPRWGKSQDPLDHSMAAHSFSFIAPVSRRYRAPIQNGPYVLPFRQWFLGLTRLIALHSDLSMTASRTHLIRGGTLRCPFTNGATHRRKLARHISRKAPPQISVKISTLDRCNSGRLLGFSKLQAWIPQLFCNEMNTALGNLQFAFNPE